MANEDKETLVDHWLRRAKNQPILAILFVSSMAIGAVASLTDSVSKVAVYFRKAETGPQTPALKPDQVPVSPTPKELLVKERTVTKNGNREVVTTKEWTEAIEPELSEEQRAQNEKEKTLWQKFPKGKLAEESRQEETPLWKKFKPKE